MSSTSKRFLEVTLSEETEFSPSDEEVNNRMEMLEENLINLTLASKAEDDDHGRLFRKKARAKKVFKGRALCLSLVLIILTHLRCGTSGTSWCLCRCQC